jgi:hypothetical protein
MNLFTHAPEPKQLVRDRVGYGAMTDDDRKNYESQVVSFFLLNLQSSPRSSH